MKRISPLKTVAGVMCILLATAVHAQADASPASTAVSSSSPHAVQAMPRATRKADRKLELEVRRALAKTKGIDVSNIFVRARGGAIVLSGTVPSGEQIQRAEVVASGVAGVTSVSNRLSLSPEGGA